MADVFISCSRREQDFVRTLHQGLRNHGRETWVDREGIPPTAEWLAEVYAAIDAADTFAFVISPDSIASEIAQLELAHAVQHHKRLVPIVRVDVEAQEIPQALAALNWIFFREHDEFDQALLSLITAIDTDLDWVRAHTRLLLRAKEWDNKGQGTAWVLRGKDLHDAEEWLAQGPAKDPKPTTLQSQFIAASRKAAAKRQRITLAAVTMGFVVAVGLAIFAFTQRQIAEEQRLVAEDQRELAQESQREAEQAAEAESVARKEAESQRQEAITQRQAADEQRQLAQARQQEAEQAALKTKAAAAVNAASSQVKAGKPTLAALLVAQMVEAPEPYGGVKQAHEIAASPLSQSVLKGHTNWLLHAAFSPDGTRIVTASSDETARVWRADGQGEPVVLTGHTDYVTHAAFSPDGTRIVTASDDKTARVWRVAWKTLLTYLRESTNACLTKEQRIRYLGEDESQAQAAYETCERRYGRKP